MNSALPSIQSPAETSHCGAAGSPIEFARAASPLCMLDRGIRAPPTSSHPPYTPDTLPAISAPGSRASSRATPNLSRHGTMRKVVTPGFADNINGPHGGASAGAMCDAMVGFVALDAPFRLLASSEPRAALPSSNPRLARASALMHDGKRCDVPPLVDLLRPLSRSTAKSTAPTNPAPMPSALLVVLLERSQTIVKDEEYKRGYVELEEAQRRYYLLTFFRRGEAPRPSPAFDIDAAPTAPAAVAIRSSEDGGGSAAANEPRRASRPSSASDAGSTSPHRNVDAIASRPSTAGSDGSSAMFTPREDSPASLAPPSPAELPSSIVRRSSTITRRLVLIANELHWLHSEEALEREKLLAEEDARVRAMWTRVHAPLVAEQESADRLKIEHDEQAQFFVTTTWTSRFLHHSLQLLHEHRNAAQSVMDTGYLFLENLRYERHRMADVELTVRAEIVHEEALVSRCLLKRWHQHNQIMLLRTRTYKHAAETVFALFSCAVSEECERRRLVCVESQIRHDWSALSQTVADTIDLGSLLYQLKLSTQVAAVRSVVAWRARWDSICTLIRDKIREEEESRGGIERHQLVARNGSLRYFHTWAVELDRSAYRHALHLSDLLQEAMQKASSEFAVCGKPIADEVQILNVVVWPENKERNAVYEQQAALYQMWEPFFYRALLAFSSASIATDHALENAVFLMRLHLQSSRLLIDTIRDIIMEEHEERQKVCTLEADAYDEDFILTHQRMKRLDTVRSFILASPGEERRARAALEAEYREGLYLLMERNDAVQLMFRIYHGALSTVEFHFHMATATVEVDVVVVQPECYHRASVKQDEESAWASLLADWCLVAGVHALVGCVLDAAWAVQLAHLEEQEAHRRALDTVVRNEESDRRAIHREMFLAWEAFAGDSSAAKLVRKEVFARMAIRQLEAERAERLYPHAQRMCKRLAQYAAWRAAWHEGWWTLVCHTEAVVREGAGRRSVLAEEAAARGTLAAAEAVLGIERDLERERVEHSKVALLADALVASHERCGEISWESQEFEVHLLAVVEPALRGHIEGFHHYNGLVREHALMVTRGVEWEAQLCSNIVFPESEARLALQAEADQLADLAWSAQASWLRAQHELEMQHAAAQQQQWSEVTVDADVARLPENEEQERLRQQSFEHYTFDVLTLRFTRLCCVWFPSIASLPETHRQTAQSVFADAVRSVVTDSVARLNEIESTLARPPILNEEALAWKLLLAAAAHHRATVKAMKEFAARLRWIRAAFFSLVESTGSVLAQEQEARDEIECHEEALTSWLLGSGAVILDVFHQSFLTAERTFQSAFENTAAALLHQLAALEHKHPTQLLHSIPYILLAQQPPGGCLDFSEYDGLHPLSDETLHFTATLLRKSPSITDLRLSNNLFVRRDPHIPSTLSSTLTPLSLPMLGPLLSRLRVLELRNCGLRDSDLHPSFTRHLAEPSCCLETLALDDNDLSSAFCKDMYSLLREQTTLTSLTLGGNAMISKGMLQVLSFYCSLNRVGEPHKSDILEIERNGADTRQWRARAGCALDDEVVKLACVALFQNTHIVDVSFAGQRMVTDVSCTAIASMLRGNATIGALDLSGTSVTDLGIQQIEHVLKGQPYRQPVVYQNLFLAAPSAIALRRRSSRSLRAREAQTAMVDQGGFALSLHHTRISEQRYLAYVFAMNQMERAWIEVDEDEVFEALSATAVHLRCLTELYNESEREHRDEFDAADVRQGIHFLKAVFVPMELRQRAAVVALEAQVRDALRQFEGWAFSAVKCFDQSFEELQSLSVKAHHVVHVAWSMQSWRPSSENLVELENRVAAVETTCRHEVEALYLRVSSLLVERYHKFVQGSLKFFFKVSAAKEELIARFATAVATAASVEKHSQSSRSFDRVYESMEYMGGALHGDDTSPALLEPKQYQALALLPNQPFELQGKGLAIAQNDPSVTSLDVSFAGVANNEEPRCTPDTIAILYTLAKNNTCLQRIDFSGNVGAVTQKSAHLVAKLMSKVSIMLLQDLNLDEETVLPLLLSGLVHPSCRVTHLAFDGNPITAHGASLICRALRSNVTVQNLGLTRLPGPLPKATADYLAFYTAVNSLTPPHRVLLRRLEADDPTCHSAALDCIASIPLSEVDERDVDSRAGTVSDEADVERDSSSLAPLYQQLSALHHAANLSHSREVPDKPLDDAAVKLLCIALTRNKSVESLRLRGNAITDRGIKFLAHVLQSSPSIRLVDLSHNAFSDASVQLLIHAVEKNTRVHEVRVTANNGAVSPQYRRLLAAKTQANKQMDL